MLFICIWYIYVYASITPGGHLNNKFYADERGNASPTFMFIRRPEGQGHGLYRIGICELSKLKTVNEMSKIINEHSFICITLVEY